MTPAIWPNLAVNWTASTLRVPAASYFRRWAHLRMKTLLLLLTIFLSSSSIAASALNVNYLKAGEPRIDGGACEFSDREGVILRSDWVNRYWLRIDGVLTEIRSTKSDAARDTDIENNRISEMLSKGGTTLALDLKLTARGEDSATYAGRMILAKDKVKKEYRISGGCGA